MFNQQQRIAAYEEWYSATKEFEEEMQRALKDESYDHERLRKLAVRLQQCLEEYRRVWELH